MSKRKWTEEEIAAEVDRLHERTDKFQQADDEDGPKASAEESLAKVLEKRLWDRDAESKRRHFYDDRHDEGFGFFWTDHWLAVTPNPDELYGKPDGLKITDYAESNHMCDNMSQLLAEATPVTSEVKQCLDELEAQMKELDTLQDAYKKRRKEVKRYAQETLAAAVNRAVRVVHEERLKKQ